MGQIVSSLNTRPYGTLPADTQPNPRTDRTEHCKMITLRSGKELAGSKVSNIEKSSKGQNIVASNDDDDDEEKPEKNKEDSEKKKEKNTEIR